ncbi:MAG: hypothetical protein ACYTHM_05410 [Planctomycetota bacterium]|jgi:hypothetical protein
MNRKKKRLRSWGGILLVCAAALASCGQEEKEVDLSIVKKYENDFMNQLGELLPKFTLLNKRIDRGEFTKEQMDNLELFSSAEKESFEKYMEQNPELMQIAITFKKGNKVTKTEHFGHDEKVTVEGKGKKTEKWGTVNVTVIWGDITKPKKTDRRAIVLMSTKEIDSSCSYLLVFITEQEKN